MEDQPQSHLKNSLWGASGDSRPGAANGSTAHAPPADINENRRAQLHAACLDHDHKAVSRVISGFLVDGASVETVCEDYIPHVARRLGALWCEDTLGFSGVTIGCARLTATLRDLERNFSPQIELNSPQILILVAEDVYHTLGATVLAGILRRAGFGVQLWTGADPAAVTNHLLNAEFDAVFVSASMGESLASLQKLVATAKNAQPDVLTIVGGTILDTTDGPDELCRLTNADHATQDPDEAIEICETHLNASQSRASTQPCSSGG